MSRETKLRIATILILVIYVLLHAIVVSVVSLFHNLYLGYVATQDFIVTITSPAWTQPVEVPMSLFYAAVCSAGIVLGIGVLLVSVPFVFEFWTKRGRVKQLWWYRQLITWKWRQ